MENSLEYYRSCSQIFKSITTVFIQMAVEEMALMAGKIYKGLLFYMLGRNEIKFREPAVPLILGLCLHTCKHLMDNRLISRNMFNLIEMTVFGRVFFDKATLKKAIRLADKNCTSMRTRKASSM